MDEQQKNDVLSRPIPKSMVRITCFAQPWQPRDADDETRVDTGVHGLDRGNRGAKALGEMEEVAVPDGVAADFWPAVESCYPTRATTAT